MYAAEWGGLVWQVIGVDGGGCCTLGASYPPPNPPWKGGGMNWEGRGWDHSLRPVPDPTLSCSDLGHGQRAACRGTGDFGDGGCGDAAGLERLFQVGGLDEAGGDE